MPSDISSRNAHVLVTQERALAVVKAVASLAGLGVAAGLASTSVALPPALLVTPVYAALLLSSAITLWLLRGAPERGLRPVRFAAMFVEVVALVALAAMHAGVDHGSVALVLVLLPLAAAVRFGPLGAVAVGAVLVAEPFLRDLVRVHVLGLPSDLVGAVILTMPAVLATAVAALLAWSAGRQAELAMDALRLSERSRRQAEASSHVTRAALEDIGPHALDGLARAMALELDLPSLVVLRADEAGTYTVVSAHGIDLETCRDGVPIDADGPIDRMTHERRTVHIHGPDLTHIRTGRPDAESELAVPITVRNRIRGAIIAESPDPADHGPDVAASLEALAAHVGLLFEAQRTYDEQEHRARRYRELDAISNRVITVASHEFRTPLTSILGFSEVLVDRDERLDDAGRRRLASAIHRAARRLHRLLEDLTRMHTLERGQVLSAMNTVAIDEIVRGLAREEAWPDRVHIIGDDAVVGRVDPDLLREVVVKLVENALAHGEPPVTVRWYVEGRWLHVRVEDHGAGLPEGRAEEMFSPWIQHVDVMAHSQGSGLGLPIARGLAETMRGRLEYDDRIPGICAFALTVPLDPTVEVSTPSLVAFPRHLTMAPAADDRAAAAAGDDGEVDLPA